MRIKHPGISYLTILTLLSAFSITAQNTPTGKVKADQKSNSASTENTAEKEKKAEDQLARIAIVAFEDRTNSKNFQYLSESLVEAIFTSMYKEFAFEQIKPADVKKALFNAQQELMKKKLSKNGSKKPRKEQTKKAEPRAKESKEPKEGEVVKEVKVKTPEEMAKDEEQLEAMKLIAKELPAEIVIFGNYKYDQVENQIVFSVRIYMASTKTTREIEDTRNPVDNTIFKATANVAKSLVEEIHLMVEEAQKSIGETAAAKTEAEKDTKPAKLAITRKIASAPTLDLNVKKFALLLSPGFGITPAAYEVDWTPENYEVNGGVIEMKFFLSPYFTLSAAFKYLNYGVKYTDGLGNQAARHDFDFFQGIAYAGIGYVYKKLLRPYIDIGAGYYYGKVSSNYQSDGETTVEVYNPVFSAKAGVDMLMLPNFITGMGLNYCYLYDEPYPVHSLDFFITLGVIF